MLFIQTPLFRFLSKKILADSQIKKSVGTVQHFVSHWEYTKGTRQYFQNALIELNHEIYFNPSADRSEIKFDDSAFSNIQYETNGMLQPQKLPCVVKYFLKDGSVINVPHSLNPLTGKLTEEQRPSEGAKGVAESSAFKLEEKVPENSADLLSTIQGFIVAWKETKGTRQHFQNALVQLNQHLYKELNCARFQFQFEDSVFENLTYDSKGELLTQNFQGQVTCNRTDGSVVACGCNLNIATGNITLMKTPRSSDVERGSKRKTPDTPPEKPPKNKQPAAASGIPRNRSPKTDSTRTFIKGGIPGMLGVSAKYSLGALGRRLVTLFERINTYSNEEKSEKSKKRSIPNLFNCTTLRTSIIADSERYGLVNQKVENISFPSKTRSFMHTQQAALLLPEGENIERTHYIMAGRQNTEKIFMPSIEKWEKNTVNIFVITESQFKTLVEKHPSLRNNLPKTVGFLIIKDEDSGIASRRIAWMNCIKFMHNNSQIKPLVSVSDDNISSIGGDMTFAQTQHVSESNGADIFQIQQYNGRPKKGVTAHNLYGNHEENSIINNGKFLLFSPEFMDKLARLSDVETAKLFPKDNLSGEDQFMLWQMREVLKAKIDTGAVFLRSSGDKHAALTNLQGDSDLPPAYRWLQLSPDGYFDEVDQRNHEVFANHQKLAIAEKKKLQEEAEQLADTDLLKLYQEKHGLDESQHVPPYELRDYQKNAVRYLIEGFYRTGDHSLAVLDVPMGCGKTEIIKGIFNELIHTDIGLQKKHVALVSPTKELAEDLAKRLKQDPRLSKNVIVVHSDEESTNTNAGILALNTHIDEMDETCIFVFVQKSLENTIQHRPDFLSSLRLCVLDEAHKTKTMNESLYSDLIQEAVTKNRPLEDPFGLLTVSATIAKALPALLQNRQSDSSSNSSVDSASVDSECDEMEITEQYSQGGASSAAQAPSEVAAVDKESSDPIDIQHQQVLRLYLSDESAEEKGLTRKIQETFRPYSKIGVGSNAVFSESAAANDIESDLKGINEILPGEPIRGICWVPFIPDAEKLQKELTKKDIRSVVLHSGIPSADYQKSMKELETLEPGKTLIALFVQKGQEGLDLPSIPIGWWMRKTFDPDNKKQSKGRLSRTKQAFKDASGVTLPAVFFNYGVAQKPTEKDNYLEGNTFIVEIDLVDPYDDDGLASDGDSEDVEMNDSSSEEIEIVNKFDDESSVEDEEGEILFQGTAAGFR